MTSKSPMRTCEDVDATALSFAEIKALCAGDPRIKERMDLDVEVSRLRLMKADHQSKQFRLQDNLLTYYPKEIERNQGFLRGLEADLKTAADHPHPLLTENQEDNSPAVAVQAAKGFAGMEILGIMQQDKEAAGAMLLELCKQTKSTDAVPIGSYRGFSMSLLFDIFNQEYELTLHGEMTHRVKLGTDARGNLTRIDNALSQIPQRIEAVKAQLDNLHLQQKEAEVESNKPFPFEEELKSKSARLAFRDTELNLSKGTMQTQESQAIAKSARPSVLDKLKAVEWQPSSKPGKQREEVL